MVKKRTVWIICLSVVLAFAFAMAGIVGSKTVKADAPTTFEMIEGASLRLTEGDVGGDVITNGIRFQVKMDKDTAETVDGIDVKLYFFIAPINVIDLTDGVSPEEKSAIESHPELWLEIDPETFFGEEEGDKTANAVICNLSGDYLNTTFNAIAILDDNGSYYYATPADTAISLYDIVNAAVLNTAPNYAGQIIGEDAQLPYTDWYGTEDFPIAISTAEQFAVIKDYSDYLIGKTLTVENESIITEDIDGANFVVNLTASVTYDVIVGADSDLDISKLTAKDVNAIDSFKLVKTSLNPYAAYDKDEIASFDFAYSNKTLTISGGELNGHGGEYVGYITIGNTTYVVYVNLITDVIGTKEQFVSFMEKIIGLGGCNLVTGELARQEKATTNVYAVLTADIDMKNTDLSTIKPTVSTNAGNVQVPKTYNKVLWSGIFDGRGFVVSNVVVDCSGIFSYINGATLKNVAFVNIFNNVDNSSVNMAGLVGSYVYNFVMSNCYIEGGYTKLGTMNCERVIAGYTGSDSLIATNCIFKITNASNGLYNAAKAKSENNYVISDMVKQAYNPMEDGVIFADLATLNPAEKVTKANGFNDYWEVNGNAITFGSYTLLDSVRSATSYDVQVNTESTLTLPSEVQGNYEVYFNGVKLTPNVVGRDLTFANNVFTETGVKTLKFKLADKFVECEVNVVNKIIKTASDLDDLVKLCKSEGSGAKTNHKTVGYVAILGNDIDYNNGNLVTNTSMIYNQSWYGTFDGRGHTISNITVGQGGIFGYLRSSAVVKNLGLINVTNNMASTANGGGLLAYYVVDNSVIDNCYIEGTFTNSPAKSAGIVWVDYNKVNNCVVKVSNAVYGVCGLGNGNESNKVNTYTISTDATKSCVNLTSDIYNDIASLISANVIKAENNFNEYWTVNNGQLSFGSYTVLDRITVREGFALGAEEYSIVTTGTASNVKIDDKDATCTPTDGKITFDKTYIEGLAKGAHTISFETATTICSGSLVIGTDVISTKQQFIDFFTKVVGYGSKSTTSNTIYAVLANDINMEDFDMSTISGKKFDTTYWCGIFDGCGFVVKNVIVDRGGVFSHINGGTVKNVAFVNIVNNKEASKNDTGGGLIAAYLNSSAKIDNCYVEGSYDNLYVEKADHSESVFGAFCYGQTLTNCVAKVENVVYGLAKVVSGSNAKNFVISSSAEYVYTNVDKTASSAQYYLFATVAKFNPASKITAANNFNSCWKVENGVMYFGSYAIKD